MDELHLNTARNIAQCLARLQFKLVLAESCTSGRIAAVLGCLPRISDHFCGSSVVYREQTKIRWLGIDPQLIDEHSAVSAQITSAISQGVLQQTPEAHLSLGITGHFGPGAPPADDGVVYLAVWKRQENDFQEVGKLKKRLDSAGRAERQIEATHLALVFLRDCLGQL